MKRPAAGTERTVTRKLGRRLGCGCLSLLLFLAIGMVGLEWFLRSSGGHFFATQFATRYLYEPAEDGRSCRLHPGWTGEQVVQGKVVRIRINADGMRGPDPGRKEAGERRVLVLGDSFVFGQGVAEDATIPARLEAELQTRLERRVRVGNAGVPSHGTRDMAPSFERHRSFGADAVVACTYIGNDFVDDCREYCDVVDGHLLFGPMARMATESTRFRLALVYRSAYLIEGLLARYLPALAFEPSRIGTTDAEEAAMRHLPELEEARFGGFFMDRREEDALVRQVLDRCTDSYRRLADVTGDVPVLHVLIPTWWHLAPEDWRKSVVMGRYDPDAYEPGAAQRRLLGIARRLGLHMVDLTPLLRDAPDRDSLWIPEDRHLSAKGCAAVARWITPDVLRLLER